MDYSDEIPMNLYVFFVVKKAMQIQDFFAGIDDPRTERHKLHSIEDILTLTLLALLCRVKSWENIELFGKTK